MKNQWMDLLRSARKNPRYRADLLKFDVSVQLRERLHDIEVSQVELAKRLGVSEAAVSKLLRGTENHTLSKLVDVAATVGLDVEVRLLEKMKVESVRRLIRAFTVVGGAVDVPKVSSLKWTRCVVSELQASNEDDAYELEPAAA